MLNWLIHTNAGLLTRITAGVVIFMVMAIADRRAKGEAATRWREYGVLLIATLTALIYGAVNDQITVTISPEYFIYGKELDHKIGESPRQGQLRWEAAKIGLKATWSAGLLFGVALLLANNPFRALPRLQNRSLVRLLPVIILTAATLGVIGGLLGYAGYLTALSDDFAKLVTANYYRPRRFMSAWGIHLGGYVGGFLGTVVSCAMVYHRRLRARAVIKTDRVQITVSRN